jgi:transposase
LSENQSISQGSIWINRPEVLKEFDLEPFHERTLFRVFEITGNNHEEIMYDIQDRIFSTYQFEHTDTIMDWTSFVLYGLKCSLGKHGYSRDHRPDKKQITMGLSALAPPINIPIGMTIQPGNVPDTTHFSHTFNQVKGKLKPGSLITFDRGAVSKDNRDLVLQSKMKYITGKRWNSSDDKVIELFSPDTWELVDEEDQVYGYKKVFPSRVDYFYFSEKLQQEQLQSKARAALRKLEEAKRIQRSLDNKRGLPKEFQINNPLVEVKYWYQTKLQEMDEEEALSYLMKSVKNGREGFFCVISSEDLTLGEALSIYRMKDAIEKIFHSLKNEIEIKPLRVWSDASMYGALILGFLAQLIISLMRYDVPKIQHTSPKFIKRSLQNLTVTVEFQPNGRKRRIFSNFDPINQAILVQNRAFG